MLRIFNAGFQINVKFNNITKNELIISRGAQLNGMARGRTAARDLCQCIDIFVLSAQSLWIMQHAAHIHIFDEWRRGCAQHVNLSISPGLVGHHAIATRFVNF